MNILIVGGAGYIGGAITDILHGTNHRTRVYDSLIYEESYRKPSDFIFGDVRDVETLSEQLVWADAVIWLAALVGDGACAINPDISKEINQDSVRWLCENYDGRIIFTSTCSVYGAQDGILSEESLTGPLSVYARTKLAAERYLEDKNALVFRVGTLFGISDLFARLRLDLVVNVMTVRAALEGELTVYGGEQFRPLLHVRDVAEAIVQYVDTEHTGIYNLHRQNVRIVDLAFQVARNYRVSSDKLRTALGWRPKYSIDDGIIEIKELIETKRLKDVMNPRYTNQAFLTRCVSELQQYKVPVLNTKIVEHAR
jgi:nucleoside-diphosphate-sugar epimerase